MAGRAGAPRRPGAPLRELRPRRRRRARRGPRRRSPRSTGSATRSGRGSSTGRASPARSAAPAGPGSNRAPTTSSRSSRCGGWSPQRDQVVRRRRWAPGASFLLTWQTLLNSVTFGHNVALAALGTGTRGARRGALAAADRRPRQRRPGDPGGDLRAAGRAVRRALPPRRRGRPALRTALGSEDRGGRPAGAAS